MVNEWTADDLPVAFEDSKRPGQYWNPSSDMMRDLVVWLNAHHPKPPRGDAALADHLGRQAVAIDELQVDLEAAEAERDRWRRAREIVEQERDQARESLHEACKVAQSYKVDAYQATERAEAAEARTAPAVSRADVAEALSRCINPEMWNVTFPSVVSEVCDLFGVEAGQAVDPLLDKAQEFAALADWELTDREAELLHTVAAHVLGQEVK